MTKALRFMKASRSYALLLDCISAGFRRTLAILAKNFRGLSQGIAGSYFAYYAGTGTAQLQSVTDVVQRAEFPVWKGLSGFGSPISRKTRRMRIAEAV
ncbi:hypothetical protein [Pandoraea captiosa]|uniref:hypothetical protein n=1 Tax=Pandoraea captiosa TaxID=2508302 RepID=UPI00123F61C5|nr:hypothetical protein [Pandoraea captiosa]